MIQAVALFCMFGFGVVITCLGALKLPLSRRLGIDNARFGGLISTLMLTSAVVVLVIGPVVDWAGHKSVTIFGLAAAAAGILTVSLSRRYAHAFAGSVLLGVGGITLCTVSSTLFPVVFFGGANPPAASNLGNSFFGAGAFLAAFVAGAFQKKRGAAHTCGTGVVLALLVLAGIVPALLASYPPANPSGYDFARALSLVVHPVVITAALTFFMCTGIENTLGNWISTYFAELGFSDRTANMLLSLFWVCFAVSRLAASAAVSMELAATGAVVLSAVMILTLCAMLFNRSKAGAVALVILSACAIAPITPTVTGLMFAKIDRSLYGSAFSIFFAIGLLGSSTIPAAVGVFSKGRRRQHALYLPLAAAALMAALSYRLIFV